MKRFLKIVFFAVTFFLIIVTRGVCFADPPGPPAGHGLTENQGPFDAPVGNGLMILIVLGIGYGGFMFYKTRNKITDKDPGQNVVVN